MPGSAARLGMNKSGERFGKNVLGLSAPRSGSQAAPQARRASRRMTILASPDILAARKKAERDKKIKEAMRNLYKKPKQAGGVEAIAEEAETPPDRTYTLDEVNKMDDK